MTLKNLGGYIVAAFISWSVVGILCVGLMLVSFAVFGPNEPTPRFVAWPLTCLWYGSPFIGMLFLFIGRQDLDTQQDDEQLEEEGIE